MKEKTLDPKDLLELSNPTASLATSSDTLKFIGKTENHFVFTDLQNAQDFIH